MLIMAIIICAYLFFDAFRHFALSGKSAVKFMQRAGHRLSVSGPPKNYFKSSGWSCFPSSAASTVFPISSKSAAKDAGFFSGSSCPKGTK